MYRLMKLLMGSSRRNKRILELQSLSGPIVTMGEDIDTKRLLLEKTFAHCSDVVFRTVSLFGSNQAVLVYVDGMIDPHSLLQGVLDSERIFEGKELLSIAEKLEQTLTIGRMHVTNMADELVKGVLDGGLAIVLDGAQNVLIVGMEKFPSRNVEEPEAEPVVRGPREGFIEEIKTNTILLRKRLRTSRLKIESFTLGELSQTKVLVAYISGIATDSVVKEVRERVSTIKIDGVIDSGYIEEFIEDMPFSPFPQVQNTERPDVVMANLLEGKIAILVDGSPNVLIVPMTFWSALQNAEDYYERFIIGSFIRWIRFLCFIIALLLPAVYVAISTFHPEMIPTNLLMSLAGARETNPFPAIVEAFGMEIIFEALREAGVRLPKQVGSAVSIVGALVIGQAAVQAGLVSAPIVIVVSITGIANFAIPKFNVAIGTRLLRFPMILLGGTFGLYGVGVGLLGILIHLSSLRSFGIPYFEPVAPLSLNGLKDVLIRTPHWALKLRPRLTGYQEPLRVPPGQKPAPDRNKEKGGPL
ncbi:spore germination protein [Paenibacillus baimaensis]|nr:spore germination protein [Paenibacillus sp. WQ 127069]